MVMPAILAVTMPRDPVALPLNNSLKLIYRLVRLHLIVEVFVAFRSVPIGIYQIGYHIDDVLCLTSNENCSERSQTGRAHEQWLQRQEVGKPGKGLAA